MKVILNEHIVRRILNEAIDYNAFMPKDELCPHIFNENASMKKEVRQVFLKAADDFYDFIQFDFAGDILEDVWLVGSLAGYNWSERYSDADVHLIMDFAKISDNKDLVDNDVWALKTLYNQKHNIEVKGFGVEMYAQDKNEEIKSDGIYSIKKQTWIKKPKKREIDINKRKIASLVSQIEKKMEDALKQFRLQNFGEAYEMSEDIKDMVAKLRKDGLADKGEFDEKNLAFKALRRGGILDKLDKLYIRAFDKDVSLELNPKQQLERDGAAPVKAQPDGKSSKQQGKKQEDEESDEKYADGIAYVVNGKKYASLRDAEDATGIAKSTIEYRVNSDSSKWNGYKKLT